MMLLVYMLFVVSYIATGQVIWNLGELPAVFGKDVQLVCTLPNNTFCCRKYNRIWNVGWKYTLTIMNDKSTNDTKYCEELDEDTHKSIITIRDFSVGDVNIPYECVYGFWKYRATLVLKEDEFEFHPEEQLPVKPAVNGYNISLNVTFQLVYPVPVCTAIIGVKNISSELILSSTTTQLLYMSTIVLDYRTSPNECTKSLIVTCLVGRTVLKVADFTPCASQDSPSMLFAIGIVVAVCAVVFFLILLTVCWYARRKRKKNIGENDKRENVPLKSRQDEGLANLGSQEDKRVTI